MKNQCNKVFWEYIQSSYGSPQELASVLDTGVEMLFYIEENAFSRREVQHVVSAIRDITKALRENKT